MRGEHTFQMRRGPRGTAAEPARHLEVPLSESALREVVLPFRSHRHDPLELVANAPPVLQPEKGTGFGPGAHVGGEPEVTFRAKRSEPSGRFARVDTAIER